MEFDHYVSARNSATAVIQSCGVIVQQKISSEKSHLSQSAVPPGDRTKRTSSIISKLSSALQQKKT